jgi:hypothetical protein
MFPHIRCGCSTIRVPKCPTEGLDLFLNNPKTKANFDLQHYVNIPTPTTLVSLKSLSIAFIEFKRTTCLSLGLQLPS